MAALLKLSDSLKQDACKASDDDGLLVTNLLEALTTTSRFNVGAYGRSTYSPSNYATAGQSIDQHLTGIDAAIGSAPSHALGGSGHTADTLANLNTKVSDATLIDTADGRIPTQDENNALAGTSGSPSSSNRYVTNADPRNTDYRYPLGSVRIRAYKTGTQAIVDDTLTVVIFNAETYDPGGDFNTSTSAFTAPATGYYLVNVSMKVQGGAFTWNWFIYRNGTNIHASTWQSLAGWSTIITHDVVYMTSGQYIEIKIAQYSGSNKSITYGETYTHLEVARLL